MHGQLAYPMKMHFVVLEVAALVHMQETCAEEAGRHKIAADASVDAVGIAVVVDGSFLEATD